MSWWQCWGMAARSGPVHGGSWAPGDRVCSTLSRRPREKREAVVLGGPTGNMGAVLGVTDRQRSPIAGEAGARGWSFPCGWGSRFTPRERTGVTCRETAVGSASRSCGLARAGVANPSPRWSTGRLPRETLPRGIAAWTRQLASMGGRGASCPPPARLMGSASVSEKNFVAAEPRAGRSRPRLGWLRFFGYVACAKSARRRRGRGPRRRGDFSNGEKKQNWCCPRYPSTEREGGVKPPLPQVHGSWRVERSSDAGETSCQRSRNQPANVGETIAQTQAKRTRAGRWRRSGG